MSSVGNRGVMGSSSVAKRQAENVVGKSMAVPAHMAKKRPALANVTNQRPRNGSNVVCFFWFLEF